VVGLPSYTGVTPLPRSRTWEYLRAGVPVTLLCDLLFVDGPPSREILTAEALADDVARSHPASASTPVPQASTPTG